MKRTLIAAFAATLFASAAHADTLKICAEGAYPPFSLTNEAGNLEGFDIDIANALCDEMGVSCEIKATEWDGIIPALLEKKCDAIIASMSITEERKKQIDFTTKYYNTPAKFVAADDADFELTADGLSDLVVGVQRGTVHQDFMEGEFPDVELKLYGTQDEVYLDLAAGRLDVIIQDSVAAKDGFLDTDNGKGFAFIGPDYAIPKYHGEGAGIGIRKEDVVLKYALSGAIDAILKNGKYGFINAKYFDFLIY